jgi:hypothetical protein
MALEKELEMEMVLLLELAKASVSVHQFAIATLPLWLRRGLEVASQIGVDQRRLQTCGLEIFSCASTMKVIN